MSEITPWAVIVIKTDFGFISFETVEAYEAWKVLTDTQPLELLPGL